MEEDRTADNGKQEPPASPNQISVDFLDRLDGLDKSGLFLAGSIPGDRALRVAGRYTDEKLLALPTNERHHVTGATFPPGLTSRDDSQALTVWAIVFDDVGKKIPAPPGATSITAGVEVDEDLFALYPLTSWRIETREGRSQYGYHFSPALEPAIAKYLIEQLKKRPEIGPGGLHAIGQYLRLPSGMNSKPDGKNFKTTLTDVGPSITLEEFCEGFGIDLDAPAIRIAARHADGLETLSPERVKALLELFPNDDLDYDLWIKVGHAVWGATGGSLEGREVFVWWSSQSKKFDIGQSSDKTWDSFFNAGASASTLRRLIEETFGVDSPERQKVSQICAGDVFGEVSEDVLTAAEAQKVERKLDELLRAINKTQKIPSQHKSGDDRHWALNGKVQTLRDAATAIVAPPVVLTPYERGVMSVLGGMPGLGKSLLILQQALAISYDRADLLRHGSARMNFAGDVIYISNEDGLGLMKRRFKAWEKRNGLEGVVPPYEVIPLKSTLMRREGNDWQHECLQILEMILEWVSGGRDISMIVVDTLATSVTGVDENAVKDMAPVMGFLDRLSKAFWASVVFIHHLNKGAMADEDRSLAGLRGSVSIGGAVRGVVTLSPASKSEVTEFGWEGRDVICEYVAKANDDKARYVACYYELGVEGILVGDAVDPTKQVLQPTPVLIPIIPTRAIDDVGVLKGWFTDIETAIGNGQDVQVYAAGARNTSVDSVHHVLGVTVKKAAEIVTKLREMGWIIVSDGWSKSKHKGVFVSLPKGDLGGDRS